MAVLHEAGDFEAAARLLGLLDRLHLRFGLLLDTRRSIEQSVLCVPELRRWHLEGQESTTIEVIRLTHTALEDLAGV
jgi:hypothetical protein